MSNVISSENFVRGVDFSCKPYLALGFAFLVACTPPAEENEESGTVAKASCEVSASGNVQVGSEYTADLSCKLPGIYQGKKLQISYGQNINSLKLVVGEEEQEGQNSKIIYKLPAKPTFDAKVKLTASTAGASHLGIRILGVKSKWEYTAVRAGSGNSNSGGVVSALSFDSMKSNRGKTYTRGILNLQTTQAISSHDTLGACSTTAGTLLISSDDFVNCEAVHVDSGGSNNKWLIPKAEWKTSTTYKIGVRLASGNVSKFKKSGADVSFTTGSLTHDRFNRLDMGTDLKLAQNGVYLTEARYASLQPSDLSAIKGRCFSWYSDYQNLANEKMRIYQSHLRDDQIIGFSGDEYRVHTTRSTVRSSTSFTSGPYYMYCIANPSPRP